MRFHEPPFHYQLKGGVMTMEDVAKERRATEAAARRTEEKRQQKAKEATKGIQLPGLEAAL